MERKFAVSAILILIVAAFLFFVQFGSGMPLMKSILENTSKNLDSRTLIIGATFQDNFESVLFNNRRTLKIPTYDGSGQVVHPDVYYNASGWNGYKYWLAITPYPNGNYMFENPSIITSDDGINWKVPPGLTNPLDAQPGVGYNSDPNLAYKNGILYIWYREVSGGYNKLKMRNSSDGVNWSDEYSSLEMPNHGLLSPSIIYNSTDDKFYMWNVVSPGYYVVLRNSSDGITWSAPKNTSIAITDKDVWHVNTEYDAYTSTYYMVMVVGTVRVSWDYIYFAYSKNMIDWTVVNEPMMSRSSSSSNSVFLYQSAILPLENEVKLWYSAKSSENKWSLGFATTSRDDFERLSF